MKLRNVFGLALVACLALTTGAQAQLFGRRQVYAQPQHQQQAQPQHQQSVVVSERVVSETVVQPGQVAAGQVVPGQVVPGQVVPGQPVETRLPTGGKPLSPCPPGGPCGSLPGTAHCRPPTITHVSNPLCECKEDCKPISIAIAGTIPTYDTMTPYYKSCVDTADKVCVPVIISSTEEYFKFETKTIDLICCKIDVCVPTERCLRTSKKCEVRERADTKLQVCRRYNGTIDVYAIDVPGMYTKYVLNMAITDQEFKTLYPNAKAPNP